MGLPRFTIIGIMVAVVVVAILLTAFRLYSFMGVVALLPFGITSLVARSGLSPTLRRRALWVGAFGTLLLPFLAATGINHEMWGFYVSRPPVDRRVVEASQIETISRVESGLESGSRVILRSSPIGEIEDYIRASPPEGDYYVLEGRVIRDLKNRQALPAKTRGLSASRLEGLYQAVCDTGRLDEGEKGYPDAKKLSGIVVEATGRDGRPLLFVGARGREVSNDHYPYYELLFTSDSTDGPLELLSFRRFYFDVAGIEGLEWPAFFWAFSFLSLIPTIPVQGFILRRGRPPPEGPAREDRISRAGYDGARTDGPGPLV